MRRALCLIPAFLMAMPVCAQTTLRVAATPSRAPADLSGNPLESLHIEDLSATRERPLFSLTRRPPAPLRVDAAPPPPPPVENTAVAIESPPFDLVGAVVGEGGSYALLRNRTTKKVTRLRPGDETEGWRVGVVGIRSVVLDREGRTESLALAGSQAAPGATPAPEIAGVTPDAAAPAVADLRHAIRKALPDH